MKIRNGFVSNSSSSSFVCEICGRAEGGYELGLSEAGMTECENYHVFCEEHLLEIDYASIASLKIKSLYTEPYDEDTLQDLLELEKDLSRYEIRKILRNHDIDEDYVSETECPICQMQEITDRDLLAYIYQRFNINETEMTEEMKKRFATYNKFQEYLRQIKS